MKVIVQVRKDTNELDGVTIVSVDSDIDFVRPSDTHDVLEVRPDHSAIYEQLQYEAPKRIILGAAWGRELKKKPKPDAETLSL